VRHLHWRIEDDFILNPRGEIVARLIPNLSALRRRELIDHVENAERRAYAKGRQDAEEGVRAEIYEEPEDY